MAKKLSPALDGYNVAKDTPIAGVSFGVEYDLRTITVELIEAMTAKGSKLFTKKPKAEAKPAKTEEK